MSLVSQVNWGLPVYPVLFSHSSHVVFVHFGLGLWGIYKYLQWPPLLL